MRRVAWQSVAAAALTWSEHALAEDARVRLSFEARDGCIQREELVPQVEAILARPVFTATESAELMLEVEAGRSGSGFTATVGLRRASGETLGTRTFESPAATCASLSSGLPLALALMLDLPLREAPPNRHELVAAPAPPPPRPPPRGDAPSPAKVSGPVRGALAVGGQLRVGGAADVALGVGAQAELDAGPVVLGARGWITTASEVVDERTRARVLEWGAGPYLCPLHVRRGRLGVAVCGGADAGAVVARGERGGVDTAWFGALVGRVGGSVELTQRLWAGAAVGAGPYLVRPKVAYEGPLGQTTLARSAPVVLDASLFVGVRLPEK